MRKLLPFLLASLCACETEPPLQAPRIVSISPAEQLSSEPQDVVVELDMDPRFFVDYGKKSVQMLDQPVLRIGPQTVVLGTYLGHGHFQGTVDSGLEAGRYDIKVTLGDGREAVLSDAYEVIAAEKTQFSYWFDSIGPQVSGQDFTITIHVTGTNAEFYRGSVLVSTQNTRTQEMTSTWRSGAFSGGERKEHVRIDDTSGDEYLIVVQDASGGLAYSNSFPVGKN